MTKHTLSLLVEDRPGILARTTALFSRRGFNIESVMDVRTQDTGVSRIILVVDAEGHQLDQVVNQIGKLVNVLDVANCDGDAGIRRGLLLATVRADPNARRRITKITEAFHARIVDSSPETVTVEATGAPENLEVLLARLEPFGIRELVRSGTLAIERAAPSATPAGHRPARTASAGRLALAASA